MDLQTVAIWKNAWLPPSETFVKDQIASLREWHATTIGFHNLQDGLISADCAPYKYSHAGKTARRMLATRGKWATYMRHLECSEAAVLHAHFGSGGIYSQPLAKAHKIPQITTFHGADTHLFGSRIAGAERWYRHGLASLFRNGDRFIAASNYLADRLASSGAPTHKIDVVYTGTKIEPVVQSPDKRGIAFVGRLIEIKGVSDILKAVAIMTNEAARSTPISIAGDGPLRGELERLARDLELDCTFVGRLASHEIPSFLARHEIFCAPSTVSHQGTREGFGMVFLEAALQQLPVVAYASGGVQEAVAHNSTGLLAPEHDMAQLSRYLERLLLDPDEAQHLGQQGRRRVLEKFDLARQTTFLESIYSDLSR